MTTNTTAFGKPNFTAADFGRDEPAVTGASDAPMFAATPIYARSTSKRRGLGAKRPASASTASVGAATTTTAVPRATPRAAKRDDGVKKAAMVAVPALALVLGGAWLMSQPRDSGVAELTPGAPVAQAPAAPAAGTGAASTQMAAATPAPSPVARTEAARPEARIQAPTRVARARPAPAPVSAASADDVAVDTSATLPAGPQPYSALGQTAAPSPTAAPLVVPPPPVTSAPEAVNPVQPEAAPAPTTDVAPAPATPESTQPEAATAPVQ